MARLDPITVFTPGPGTILLEDDNSAPLLAPEHLMILALTAKGEAEARAANAEILAGHMCSVVCALIQHLKDNPATEHLVNSEGVVTIPAELARRVEGMQIQALETGDGDIGIRRLERAPALLVRGDRV